MQQMEPRGSVWKQARTELNDRKKKRNIIFEPGKRMTGQRMGPLVLGRGAETSAQRMTQSNRVGQDGGTLLQGRASTRSRKVWKGVGIRWKGKKKEKKISETVRL